ncbi:MAG: hypothetical protein CL607_09170 [Anaerolineaceae bacterium]|nr:hypothetical protein [Anaerolineaceae bacterium]
MTSHPLRLVWSKPHEKARPYTNKRAFSHLYEQAHIAVYRYALGLTGNAQDAEDVTADTFIKAWNARESFSGDEDAALGWLFTITKNLVIDRSRKQDRRPQNVVLDETLLQATQPLPEQQAITEEQKRALWDLLNTLAEDRRDMLVLRYMVGWQVQRIAAHLNMNPNTVSATISRTLKQLHAHLLLDSHEGGHDARTIS